MHGKSSIIGSSRKIFTPDKTEQLISLDIARVENEWPEQQAREPQAAGKQIEIENVGIDTTGRIRSDCKQIVANLERQAIEEGVDSEQIEINDTVTETQ